VKFASWKEIFEGAGMIAIIASLLFVGMQLKQSQQIGISDVVANRNERNNALTQQIIENADIWHKACIGEPLDPVSRHVASAIFNSYVDNLLSAWITSGSGLIRSEPLREQIINNAAAQLWSHPGLRDMLHTREAWQKAAAASPGGTLFTDVSRRLHVRLQELLDSDLEPQEGTGLCGLL
jgi:hypothetical protein